MTKCSLDPINVGGFTNDGCIRLHGCAVSILTFIWSTSLVVRYIFPQFVATQSVSGHSLSKSKCCTCIDVNLSS